MSPAPLRRTRGDLIASAVIAIVVALALVGVVTFADVRQVHAERAEFVPNVARPLTDLPAELTAEWQAEQHGLPGQNRPVVAAGMTIVTEQHGVRALAPDGAQVWRYARDNRQLCQLMGAWDTAILVFRNSAGCGDVVALDGATGQYSAARSAPAPDMVHPVASNSRVGIVSPERVELWRSDLVRSVEYGQVHAKQEPHQQPHEDCAITSAATRTELLVTTERCPDDDHASWLRFQEVTPKDSRAPKIDGEVHLEEGARIVAVGQDAAAVYVPVDPPRLKGFRRDGEQLFDREVAQAPAVEETGVPFSPQTADLPHAMTWFDGQRLYLFHPTNLDVIASFDDAIGTGVAIGSHLVYPSAAGLTVVDPDSGEVVRTVAIKRAQSDGPIALAVAGDRIIEQRGTEVVGLAPPPGRPASA